jgi:hypothetical protein
LVAAQADAALRFSRRRFWYLLPKKNRRPKNKRRRIIMIAARPPFDRPPEDVALVPLVLGLSPDPPVGGADVDGCMVVVAGRVLVEVDAEESELAAVFVWLISGDDLGVAGCGFAAAVV